ncbi:hypothetical protein NDU88_003430 [Pleurodeles waltl]|uniref:Uncharacterized protein n=1 Tax=Pleurodeles waltl TaxID=8319 RepID=A0AAV7NKM5_PLEWA|nr:hypothetical protein NDU88_003430 [Pleurodeles waltl]
MLPVVQVSALVEGDTRPSPAASEGCPLGMMLVTVVETAGVQVEVQVAIVTAVPFLQEDGPNVGLAAAVEPVDSEEKEAEEEDIDNQNNIIMQYFQ